MRQNTKVIALFLPIFLVIVAFFSSVSFAQETIKQDPELIKELFEAGGKAARYIWIIGTIAAIIVLAIFGIKWITANPAQKAELLEKMWPYLIGCVLLYGGLTISGWVINIFSDSLSEYVCPVASPNSKGVSTDNTDNTDDNSSSQKTDD